ncbi:MAG: hypothetical protein GC181_08405 [Bacteroidetes bacterium]|nr:hypothetical protein [Bacteroidota bacterium]
MNQLKSILSLLVIWVIAGTASGQNNCAGKFGSDSVTEMKNISMFNQYLQARDYVNAYPYWEYLFRSIPCYSKHITYYGPTIVKYQMQYLRKNNPDLYEQRKEGLIDTVLLTYRMRIKFWGDYSNVIGTLAGDYANLKPAERKQALQLFDSCVMLNGNKVDDKIPYNYMDAAIDEYKKDRYSLDSLYILYFQLQEIVDYNLQNNTKNRNDWVQTDTILAKQMKRYLTCDKIIEYFKPKTDANPTPELLSKVSKLLTDAGCEKEEYFNEIAVKNYNLSPTPEAAIAIARSYHSKGNLSKAKEYYLKGVEGIADPMDKADTYFIIANFTFSDGDCSGARKYAEKALEANPNHGKAHLIIAQCYANYLSSCDADNINGRSVFWVAVDRAVKAKSVDPSVADKANEMISKYSAQYPTTEEAFLKGFSNPEGSAYTVPCLGISTTVRYKK